VDKIEEYLKKKLNSTDISESEYWSSIYKDLKKNNYNFEKIHYGGLGGTKKNNLLSKLYHKFFQIPFRILAKKFKNFYYYDNITKKYSKDMNLVYDCNLLRQAITLSFIDDKIGNFNDICIIGDGLGSLTSIIGRAKFSSNIYLVNLSKTLYFDYIFLKKSFKNSEYKIYLIKNKKDIEIINNNNSKKIILIEAINKQLINLFNIDLFINIVSMQEMDLIEVQSYFKIIRNKKKYSNDRYFYCCNRLSKVLPDNSIIKFEDYPWLDNDIILHYSECEWMKRYYAKKFPFYLKYEGKIIHKLIKI
jgi:putative sugar O-methyltransferase